MEMVTSIHDIILEKATYLDNGCAGVRTEEAIKCYPSKELRSLLVL